MIVYKVVGNRYMEKRVNLRVEHVKHSKCRDDFLNRVKSNAAAKKEAKAKGETVLLKRLPAAPRESRTVSTQNNLPQTLAPVAYGQSTSPLTQAPLESAEPLLTCSLLSLALPLSSLSYLPWLSTTPPTPRGEEKRHHNLIGVGISEICSFGVSMDGEAGTARRSLSVEERHVVKVWNLDQGFAPILDPPRDRVGE